jgi:hypothetical protein
LSNPTEQYHGEMTEQKNGAIPRGNTMEQYNGAIKLSNTSE